MSRWITIVDRIFSPVDFRDYAKSIDVSKAEWKPSGIVLHNTAVPNLTQWAKGTWQQHIEGLVSYYRDDQKWHAGPHLFCAPQGIIAFTPLVTRGVHSPSFNSTHLGVEMVGDYSYHPNGQKVDDFSAGNGLIVHKNAISAIATLCEVFHIDSSKIILHKSDPLTTHDCPGEQVDKAMFIAAVHGELVSRKPVQV